MNSGRTEGSETYVLEDRIQANSRKEAVLRCEQK